MKLAEALGQGRRLLSGISDEAQLEAELLLTHALHTDRVHLYRRLHDPLLYEDEITFNGLLERRLNHEPVPYIIGCKEFYGLDFRVTPAAIIPRPETELLVEIVLDEAHRLIQSRPAVTIADVGVGSGSIVCALVASLPQARVIAIDISAQALALANANAQRLSLSERIRFLQGDLLEPLRAPLDIIVANLPYVRMADWERLPPEIRHFEPRQGLDGGSDGLRVIARLLRQAPNYLTRDGALCIEIGDQQGKTAGKLAKAAFPQANVEIRQDIAGLDRAVLVQNFSAA